MKLISISCSIFEGRRAIIGIALFTMCAATQAQFQLIVTETPNGSVGSGQWSGVRRYNIAGTGGAAVLGNGISSSLLSDPAGLAFSSSGELFVGNRHGNGAASSISRFNYDGVTDTYVANGTITGNSLFGTHGVQFSSTGELFAANVNGPTSRFTFTGNTATANGSINTGLARDVFLSSNGQWAYTTQGTNGNLVKFDVATGNQVGSFSIAGANQLHFGSWRNGQLFVSSFNSGTVHAIDFDSNGDVVSSNLVASANAALSVAFSPDQNEMFVASHTSGLISRYLFSSGSWVANGSINVGVDMGDIIVAPVPEPASIAAIGIGLAALARRRRRTA